MSSRRLFGCGVITTLALLAATLCAPRAAAQDAAPSPSLDAPPPPPQGRGQHPSDATGEAGRHFRRGVELYGEANYAGALVEFERAYALAPSSATLYNVGETQYQLQNYAGALRTFRRFLGEFGPNEGHRAEVERDVEVLRARVGRVSVTTFPRGADIALDDQAVGTTPLGEPLLVSVGRRKLVASMAGRAPVTEYIDVAAEDDVSVTLELRPTDLRAAAAPPWRPRESATSPQPRAPALQTVGLVAAGALAAGAVTFGVLALDESSALKNLRGAFPASSATIEHDASLTKTYSIFADSLAAAAIVVGGATLYWTFSSSTTKSPKRGSLPASRVTLGPASARFEMTF